MDCLPKIRKNAGIDLLSQNPDRHRQRPSVDEKPVNISNSSSSCASVKIEPRSIIRDWKSLQICFFHVQYTYDDFVSMPDRRKAKIHDFVFSMFHLCSYLLKLTSLQMANFKIPFDTSLVLFSSSDRVEGVERTDSRCFSNFDSKWARRAWTFERLEHEWSILVLRCDWNGFNHLKILRIISY